MSETDNTGQLPSIGDNNGSGNFVNVSVDNENTNNYPSLENENENLATSEAVSTEPFATAEPSIDAPMTMPSPSPSAAPAPAPFKKNATMTKTGKALSAKQTNLQRLRSETLADMREKYSTRFAGYDKPPKAKAYHAAGLTTIRQRDGEAAYSSALNDIMNKNDPKLGMNGRSTFAATRRAKKTPMPSIPSRSMVPNTVANRTATNRAISAIEDMGRTAKNVIDTMIQASKDMSRELGKSGNTAALTQLSKTLKKPKKKAPLSSIYEGNNSTRNNSTRNNSTRNNFSRNTLAASNLANNSTPLNLR